MYVLPMSAVKTDSTLFSSNHENSHACVWDPDGRSADCNRQNLTDVPQNLFSNMQRLYLSDNPITLLWNTSFQAYLELVELDLAYNLIYSIDIATFFPLVNMVYLSLHENPLFNVNGNMFQWMCELRYLFLPLTGLSSFHIGIKNRAPKLQMDDMEFSVYYPDKISTPSDYGVNLIDLLWNGIRSLTTENIVIDSECIPISLRLYQNSESI